MAAAAVLIGLGVVYLLLAVPFAIAVATDWKTQRTAPDAGYSTASKVLGGMLLGLVVPYMVMLNEVFG